MMSETVEEMRARLLRDREQEIRKRKEQTSFLKQAATLTSRETVEGFEGFVLLEVYGKERKLPPIYFQTKASVVLMCMLVLDDPAVDKVLEAAGFEVEDVDGNVLFPRDPLHRLADVMDSTSPIQAAAKMGPAWLQNLVWDSVTAEVPVPASPPVFKDLDCALDGCENPRRKKSKYCSLRCSNRNAQQNWLKRKGGD